LGVTLFFLGYFLVIWAMYTNRFFSSIVRIQTERNHIAVTGGPYRYVRHPGYIGMITSALGSAFLLRSSWALIPFCFYVILVIARAYLEDKTLAAELPGYAEYRLKTRHRLIPGIW
jgi:protein-S-isoprenylcysteine O-methyltransferase Ste14